MPGQLYYQTDGIVELDDFHYIDDAGVKHPINDATGTVDIVDKVTGAVVVDPVPMVYITGSDGRYKAPVRYNAGFIPRGKYKSRVTLLGDATQLHYYGELEFQVVVDS